MKQIKVTEAVHTRLKRISDSLGVSISAVIESMFIEGTDERRDRIDRMRRDIERRRG